MRIEISQEQRDALAAMAFGRTVVADDPAFGRTIAGIIKAFDEAKALTAEYVATIDQARIEWGGDDLNVDSDAVVSVGEDGVWVAAWVLA